MAESSIAAGWSADDFRFREPGREPYRFTVDDVYAMQRLGLLSDKGGVELIGGVLLMRSSDIPFRFHSRDPSQLYEAGIIAGHHVTEMIEGVVYRAGPVHIEA